MQQPLHNNYLLGHRPQPPGQPELTLNLNLLIPSYSFHIYGILYVYLMCTYVLSFLLHLLRPALIFECPQLANPMYPILIQHTLLFCVATVFESTRGAPFFKKVDSQSRLNQAKRCIAL